MHTHNLQLAHDLPFSALYEREGLVDIDQHFVDALKAEDAELFNRLMAARTEPDALDDKDHSQLILDLAPQLEQFIAQLFGIEKELEQLIAKHHALQPLYACKRLFVQRRAAKTYKAKDAEAFDGAALRGEIEEVLGEPFNEEAFAGRVMRWLDEEETHAELLDLAAKYAAWAFHTEVGQATHKDGLLFTSPKKLTFERLVPVETVVRHGVTMLRLPEHDFRERNGFALTDHGANLKQALDEAHYCIFCHNQGKDSCSKGLTDKEGNFKTSPMRVPLAGCPLEEKISEMNMLKSQAVPLGAFAVITIDNPMCAGTGHRICNDCMKSCIYQKQEPVNIPQMETRTLKDVLALPWGFEIYSLLTRWNPLNIHRPLPKPATGRKVLVCGMGPAGYTLAHHLMNDGHTVVGIDGLKIEPLESGLNGRTPTGEIVPFHPIDNASALFEDLDKRTLAGFGGVAEYGITIRWDKNFLKLIRLLLERRNQFAMFGGVRFGGTITLEDAAELGFDHVALCMGAGKPRTLNIPNGMARGVRTASDFLMALQLTGAAKKDSIANLQLRLPAVVIGGGLTAVDTCTESLAYYPVQVEKFLSRYEALIREKSEDAVRAAWTPEEKVIADEFIAHGRAIREERAAAAKAGREPDIHALIEQWGGVTLVYRRKIADAPSYRLNHEEVDLGMQEGFFMAEDMSPAAVQIDTFGHAESITFDRKKVVDGHPEGTEKVTLPARAILIAAGTSPNTVSAREFPEHFALDAHGYYFQAVNEDGQPVSPDEIAKPSKPFVLLNSNKPSLPGRGRREAPGEGATGTTEQISPHPTPLPEGEGVKAVPSISFFGDLHPSYAGNVVKAMGSAKQGYPIVSEQLGRTAPLSDIDESDFLSHIASQLVATVKHVNRLTPTIIEVVAHAPLAAKNFLPGQFYRLQNYEWFAHRAIQSDTNATILAMEGLALTGASANPETGELSTIVLEMGGSSDLCAYLEPGEPIVMMGPTGTPTETPGGETVMLVGGGLGNAVLFSIGKAFRDAGSKVLYFAGYKQNRDRYKLDEIEAASDVIIWCCDEKPNFEAGRAQDTVIHANIVEAMIAYQKGELGDVTIPLPDVDRIIAIGSDRMMAAVAAARHNQLKDWLKDTHIAIGSINSPMQCMMKEICAQCLQRHVDPQTGEESYVFSCFNQDQELDRVDFSHLNARLAQNGTQEKLTKQWIDSCLHQLKLRELAA